MSANPASPNSAPIDYVPYTPAPLWTVQRCPVCDAKGYVWSVLPKLTPDECSFCDGKKAVLVSALGSVQKIVWSP